MFFVSPITASAYAISKPSCENYLLRPRFLLSKMAVAPKTIGVDNGGTWIRLVGLDAKGRRTWSLKKKSPSVEQLPAFLRSHLKRFKGELDLLAVGSRGVWKQAARRKLKVTLHGLAKQIDVMSDVEAAWIAAFGSVEGRKWKVEGKHKTNFPLST